MLNQIRNLFKPRPLPEDRRLLAFNVADQLTWISLLEREPSAMLKFEQTYEEMRKTHEDANTPSAARDYVLQLYAPSETKAMRAKVTKFIHGIVFPAFQIKFVFLH